MRTYLLIGGIMAIIDCILAICAIFWVKSDKRQYTMHGYNVLISSVLIAWFFWPVWIAWIAYVSILMFTDNDKYESLVVEIKENTTEEEES